MSQEENTPGQPGAPGTGYGGAGEGAPARREEGAGGGGTGAGGRENPVTDAIDGDEAMGNRTGGYGYPTKDVDLGESGG